MSTEVLAADDPLIEGAPARRIGRVLRLRPGDSVVLFDGGGLEHEVCLDHVGAGDVRGRIIDRRPGRPEARLRLVLYQSLIKGGRFDWVLEKGTELGVRAFVPLLCRRNVMRPPGERSGRVERWRRVVVEAAEQRGRGVVPEVAPATRFEDALSAAPGLRLMPFEGDRAPPKPGAPSGRPPASSSGRRASSRRRSPARAAPECGPCRWGRASSARRPPAS